MSVHHSLPIQARLTPSLPPSSLYLLEEQIECSGFRVREDFVCMCEQPLAQNNMAALTVLARVLLHVQFMREVFAI